MSESKTKNLITLLKEDWRSYSELSILLFSNSIDRTVRYMRQKPPQDYKLIEKKEKGERCWFKRFRLIREV